MKIKIYWKNKETQTLLEQVNYAIDELWLNDFMDVGIINDDVTKNELNITKEPALIIEEESISFKDMIFEWIIPEIDELKSMFISIVWGWESWESWCSTWAWCGWCWTPCH